MTHRGSDLVSGRFAVDHPLRLLQDFFWTHPSWNRNISHHPQHGARHRLGDRHLLTEKHLLDSDWLLLSFVLSVVRGWCFHFELLGQTESGVWGTRGGRGGGGGGACRGPSWLDSQLTEWFNWNVVVSLTLNSDQTENCSRNTGSINVIWCKMCQ